MKITEQHKNLKHNLGTFEGFNFWNGLAIEGRLTAEDVVAWDHEESGQAEFRPSGDHHGVAAVFEGRTAINATDLVNLDRALTELGDDGEFNFLRIYYECVVLCRDLSHLTRGGVEDSNVQIFTGWNFWEIRKAAAHKLLETFFPEHHKFREEDHLDILKFDWRDFITEHFWSVSEVRLGDHKAVLVARV